MLATAARVVRAVAFGVAAVVLLGIVIYIAEANTNNAVIGTVMDAARWLADPFRFIFDFDENKTQILVNWGIAASAYVTAGVLIAFALDSAHSRVTAREADRTRNVDSARTA